MSLPDVVSGLLLSEGSEVRILPGVPRRSRLSLPAPFFNAHAAVSLLHGLAAVFLPAPAQVPARTGFYAAGQSPVCRTNAPRFFTCITAHGRK